MLTAHAEGAQVYECKAGADGKLAWAFREPIATLLVDGKTVGRHYAGPELGTQRRQRRGRQGRRQRARRDRRTIFPWLKLEVASHKGTGQLSPTSRPCSGSTPRAACWKGSCDREKAAAFGILPYSADYVFLRKG